MVSWCCIFPSADVQSFHRATLPWHPIISSRHYCDIVAKALVREKESCSASVLSANLVRLFCGGSTGSLFNGYLT